MKDKIYTIKATYNGKSISISLVKNGDKYLDINRNIHYNSLADAEFSAKLYTHSA